MKTITTKQNNFFSWKVVPIYLVLKWGSEAEIFAGTGIRLASNARGLIKNNAATKFNKRGS